MDEGGRGACVSPGRWGGVACVAMTAHGHQGYGSRLATAAGLGGGGTGVVRGHAAMGGGPLQDMGVLLESVPWAKGLSRVPSRHAGRPQHTTAALIAGPLRCAAWHLAAHMQGDEFMAGLADGIIFRNDKLTTLRLSGAGVTCDGACRLAKALETVGGWGQGGRGGGAWEGG